MDDKKIVLFAVSGWDAVEYCKTMGWNFDKIVWVLNYYLLGSNGLKGVDEVHYTEMFKTMPAYGEAVAKDAQDRGGN